MHSLSARGENVHIYNNKIDILLSFDCISVILKYCFFEWNFTKRKKTKPNYTVRVEPGAFGSVVSTDEDTRVHIDDGILNPYKDRKYTLRTLGKLLHWIALNFSESLREHHIFHLVRWSVLWNPRRYCFRVINPNQFQIYSRYPSHLLNILIRFNSPPPPPAIDFVFNSRYICYLDLAHVPYH